MKKNLLLIIPAAGLIGFSFLYSSEKVEKYHVDGIESVFNSANPPGARTGAPGEGNCTQCHAGDLMSGDGVVTFTLSGGPSYMPGDTYPITVSATGGPKNGFELTIFNAANEQVGNFTGGTNSNVVVEGGKQYVRHSSSLGEGSWTFEWTAPSTDEGELTAYYIVNKSNNNGSPGGDEIFMSSTSLPQHGVSIEENQLDKAYKVFYNNQTSELNLKFALLADARVLLNIQDLSGKLIDHYELGNLGAGDYNEILPVTNVEKSGVYLVSLFIGNNVFNRKIMFN